LLKQDYAGLQTVLVVDSRSDPLFALCERLVRELAPATARVVAVEDDPPIPTASGKCAALLRGLREVSERAQVLVFADDDVQPPTRWVGQFVAALGDEGVSVSTAYRWYFSTGAGLASHTRSAWNLVGLQIMFNDKYNFAWGGGMAIRRSDFEEWKIAEGWHKAISDDYVVTVSAKKDGRPIRFVPTALAPSREPVTFRQLLDWTRRQAFMTRIYDPRLWKFAVAPYILFNATMLFGAALLVAAALGAPLPLWSIVLAVAFVLHLPLNLLKAALFYGGVPAMLPDHHAELRKLRGAFLAGAALAPFVMIYALVKTRNLKVIEWRGKRYKVDGPLNVQPL
jgi:cellulose synthase/poly-beta-1,6-N-acetylglucosamine synthase-like glycosyltransferase